MPRVVLQVHLGLHLWVNEPRTADRQSLAPGCLHLHASSSPTDAALTATSTPCPGGGGAHLAVIYDYWPKLLLGFRVVKSSSGLPYLHQESLPFVEIFSESVVDVFGLHVPQALVLKPDLQVDRRVK